MTKSEMEDKVFKYCGEQYKESCRECIISKEMGCFTIDSLTDEKLEKMCNLIDKTFNRKTKDLILNNFLRGSRKWWTEKICNILYDYADLLRYAATEEDKTEFEKVYYSAEAESINKIRKTIEESTNYSVEKSIEKCKKKKKSTRDIGEDAIVLAVQARKEDAKKEKKEEPLKEKKKMDQLKGQLNLTDFI